MATQQSVIITDPAPWGEYVAGIGSITVETFATLPVQAGWQLELYEGRLIFMPGPGHQHGDVQTRLTLRLGGYIEAHQLGILNSTSCYNLPLPGNTEDLLCPDLSYVLPARKATMTMRGASYPVIAPDLAIEIASPSDTRAQMQAKVGVYLAAGVRLVWVVWLDAERVDVWRPSAPKAPLAVLGLPDQLDGFDVVPGFTCPVRELFAK